AVLRELNRLDEPAAQRALKWLMIVQHADGSWGGQIGAERETAKRHATVEETAQATETLLICGRDSAHAAAAAQGLQSLIGIVETNRHHESWPLETTFGSLSLADKLTPLTLSVAALGQATRRFLPQSASAPIAHTTRI